MTIQAWDRLPTEYENLIHRHFFGNDSRLLPWEVFPSWYDMTREEKTETMRQWAERELISKSS